MRMDDKNFNRSEDLEANITRTPKRSPTDTLHPNTNVHHMDRENFKEVFDSYAKAFYDGESRSQ